MNGFTFAAPRRALGLLGVLTCAAALAACTSSSPSPVPTAVGGAASQSATTSAGAGSGAGTATGGVTATAGSTGTAGSGGSGSSGGTGGSGGSGGSGGGSSPAASPKAAGTSTCLVRYLNASTGQSQGAAGSTYVNLVFKNLNNAPCTLYGFPGVSFGAGTPVSQVGEPAGRDNNVPSTVVTLQPGGYAYTTLRVVNAQNYPQATCDPVSTTYLQIYPPNTRNLLYVPYNSKACTKNIVTLTVQAVRAGTGG